MYTGLSMRKSFFCILIGCIAGLLLSAILFVVFHQHAVFGAECAKKYRLTNAMLDCDEYEESVTRLHELDSKLNEATERYVREGTAVRVAVWTRDFTTKQWAASNETEAFAPASLLKLPLLITY